jgi:hypothetical protein
MSRARSSAIPRPHVNPRPQRSWRSLDRRGVGPTTRRPAATPPSRFPPPKREWPFGVSRLRRPAARARRAVAEMRFALDRRDARLILTSSPVSSRFRRFTCYKRGRDASWINDQMPRELNEPSADHVEAMVEDFDYPGCPEDDAEAVDAHWWGRAREEVERLIAGHYPGIREEAQDQLIDECVDELSCMDDGMDWWGLDGEGGGQLGLTRGGERRLGHRLRCELSCRRQQRVRRVAHGRQRARRARLRSARSRRRAIRSSARSGDSGDDGEGEPARPAAGGRSHVEHGTTGAPL